MKHRFKIARTHPRSECAPLLSVSTILLLRTACEHILPRMPPVSGDPQSQTALKKIVEVTEAPSTGSAGERGFKLSSQGCPPAPTPTGRLYSGILPPVSLHPSCVQHGSGMLRCIIPIRQNWEARNHKTVEVYVCCASSAPHPPTPRNASVDSTFPRYVMQEQLVPRAVYSKGLLQIEANRWQSG